MSPVRPVYFPSDDDFTRWLEANHARETEVLVGFWKKGTGKPSMTWTESVRAALCFGWIDGVRKSLGDEAYTIRFTPRKTGSIWSKINVAHVEELTRLGRMRPSGLRAFEARDPAKTGIYSFERAEDATLTDAEWALLRKSAKAAKYFDARPPSYTKAALHWIVSAKKPETRRARLEKLCACSREETTLPHLTWRPAKKG
ncbi:MAG: YdeI/OmpD-associated family protein [Myxococcales bacterium]|nr:YdeI/OmpD-associated family protein [Myxococcales bacterium]